MAASKNVLTLDQTCNNMFPLYDLLRNQVEQTDGERKDTPLPDSELNELIKKIYSLDRTGRDIIFIFIRIHSLKYSNSKLLEIPFKGEKISQNENTNVCDVKFDIREFPPILTRMLNRFVMLHTQRMAEELTKRASK